VVQNVKFGLPGHHNLTNALLAFAMAKSYGVSNENISTALASFKGIRRRFSFQIRQENRVYIDDYAHHPTEINAVHQAVRELYPGKKIIAAFQPHLFSRTKDFADGFATSLSQFDEILLLDIYPARELPMEGITSRWLLTKMEHPNKKLVNKLELIAAFKNSDATVFITIGAGDIGEMVKDIKNALYEEN
jgi:UDP-N-acetylmuramate--alanine ligase